MPKIIETNFNGGINWHDSPWSEALKKDAQCVLMQNCGYKDRTVDMILGQQKYHGSTLGAYPVTAIMPYYNDQDDSFKLLAACGGSIYIRDPQTNEFTELAGSFHPNGIYSCATRYDTMYIASIYDGLKKYTGGTLIEKVGGGATAPGSFRVIVYMKEIDRMFGISDDAVLGQISWCDLGNPEVWDGASTQRFKLQDGERTETGAVLYGKLIILNTYSIWIYFVQGNEENWRLEQAPTTVGCVAPGTLRKVGNELWFLGKHPQHQYGVYAFNGSTCRLLTHDIEPLFHRINTNKVRNACAEVRDDVYRVSFAMDASEENNVSIDLDLIHVKADGTPAIYGPHTWGFCSSVVLNDRQNKNEWLVGNESGWVFKEGGNSVPETAVVEGSTTFTDQSASAHVMTAVGTAALTRGKTRFPEVDGSSLYLDGSTGYLTTPAHADFQFGTGDFTIDTWTYFTDLTGIQMITNQYTDADNQWYLAKLADNKFRFYSIWSTAYTGYYNTTAAVTLAINTWYHIEFCRYGTTAYLFVNGVNQPLTATTAFGSNSFGAYVPDLQIGRSSSGTPYYFIGNIDKIRVSKGIARHTSNFDPNATVNPIDTYTVLYLDFNIPGKKLLQSRFLSRMENNGTPDVMKQLEELSIFFKPRGYFNVDVNYYLGTGHFGNVLTFNPNTQWVGFAGDYNVYTNHIVGVPELYEWHEYCRMKARGTAFQLEIINNNIEKRVAFDAYKYQFTELFETERAQHYVP